MVSSGGRATTGTSLIHLTNFKGGDPLVTFLLYEETNRVNSSTSVGINEEGPNSPSPGAIGEGIDFAKINTFDSMKVDSTPQPS